MGEREIRRASELQAIKASTTSDGSVREVRKIAVVPMWECAGCHKRVPRGEACKRCGKTLLEG